MARFEKGNPGRKRGSRNRRTVALERIYQRCSAADFHPADALIEIARDPGMDPALRVKAASELLGYIEGKQKEGPPIVLPAPEDLDNAMRAIDRKLIELSKCIEPPASPSTPA